METLRSRERVFEESSTVKFRSTFRNWQRRIFCGGWGYWRSCACIARWFLRWPGPVQHRQRILHCSRALRHREALFPHGGSLWVERNLRKIAQLHLVILSSAPQVFHRYESDDAKNVQKTWILESNGHALRHKRQRLLLQTSPGRPFVSYKSYKL